MKPQDSTGRSAGIDTMIENPCQFKYDVGECTGARDVKVLADLESILETVLDANPSIQIVGCG